MDSTVEHYWSGSRPTKRLFLAGIYTSMTHRVLKSHQ